MQILLDIGKLKTRAKSVGISMRDLCSEAGISVSTPSRIHKRGNGHTSTLVELNLALRRLEKKRRDELQKRVTEQQESEA